MTVRITHPTLPGSEAFTTEEAAEVVWGPLGWVVDDAPVADESDGVTPPAARPADSAKKPAWVAWAVAHGADAVAAEEMTQKDLIAEYGDR